MSNTALDKDHFHLVCSPLCLEEGDKFIWGVDDDADLVRLIKRNYDRDARCEMLTVRSIASRTQWKLSMPRLEAVLDGRDMNIFRFRRMFAASYGASDGRRSRHTPRKGA